MIDDLSVVEEKVSLHFDWLSFTLPMYYEGDTDSEHVFEKLFPIFCDYLGYEIDELIVDPYPKNNYKKSYKLGEHISFRYGGQYTKMKYVVKDIDGAEEIMVDSMQFEVTGQGLREIELRGIIDYIDFFHFLYVTCDGKCNRLDLALDDKIGFLSIDWIKNKIEAGDYTTKFRTPVGRNLPYVPQGSLEDGYSITFGSRNSTQMMCIYDKKLERKFRGENYMGDNWVRWEIRFLGQKANMALDKFLEVGYAELGDFYYENLVELLQIRDRTKDTHKDRWPINKKWLEFTKYTKGVPLKLSYNYFSSIDKKKAWRDYSLSRMHVLLDMSDCYNDDHQVFGLGIARLIHELEKQLDILEEEKIEMKDIALINNYRLQRDPNSKLLKVSDLFKYKLKLEAAIKHLKSAYIDDNPGLPF